jgi:hypothetical protein
MKPPEWTAVITAVEKLKVSTIPGDLPAGLPGERRVGPNRAYSGREGAYTMLAPVSVWWKKEQRHCTRGRYLSLDHQD